MPDIVNLEDISVAEGPDGRSYRASLDFMDWAKSVVDEIAPTTNAQTGTAYTATTADRIVSMNNASANIITIPANRSDRLEVWQLGSGQTSIRGETGVMINGTDAGTVPVSAQFGHLIALRISANQWAVS